MQIFDYIIAHYGWAGTTLIALLLILFFIQIYYHAVRYGKIAKYKNSKRKKRLNDAPPISVVIPLMSEDFGFIHERLPRFLQQRYEPGYELVIIFIGTNGDFYEELEAMRLQYSNLRISKLEYNPRFPISPKQAINLGIKSSMNNHIIISAANVTPSGDEWLAMMGKGFMRGEIVLGYTAIEQNAGLGSYMIRMSRMQTAMYWLADAVKGKIYNSSRSNFGLTKSVYFEANGFSHLNMNIGENDLFLAKVARRKNTSIVMTPKATVDERQWGGLSWWIAQLRYYGSASHLYPQWARNGVEWDLRSHILFFLVALAALIFMPLEVKIATALLLLIRFAVALHNAKAIAKRLGERAIGARYILFDIFHPLMMLYLRIKLIHKDPSAWK